LYLFLHVHIKGKERWSINFTRNYNIYPW